MFYKLNNQNDIQLLISAFHFAGQRLGTEQPGVQADCSKIVHSIRLANVLAVEGNISNVQIIVAAILQCTLTDTLTSMEDIRAIFGVTVWDTVREIVDNNALQSMDQRASQLSRRAKLIKLADIICTLRSLNSSAPTDAMGAGGNHERQAHCQPYARRISGAGGCI